MTIASDQPFAIDGELPSLPLVIEASAGTGKTHALADLATRFVAERDVSTSELLIVTFTRAATNELRSRVRERFIDVADQLDGTRLRSSDDRLVVYLAERDVPQRLARLRAALTDFDAATITTIHGFATQIRSSLGVAAGVDPNVRLVEEDIDAIDETCADVMAAAATNHLAADLPRLVDLRSATRRAVGRTDMVLLPTSEGQGATPAQVMMKELVEHSVHQLSERRRRQGTRSFDDVLTELCEALVGPRSTAAIDSLRSRFKVALIDEFQDTDPVQWKIFRRLFGEDVAGTTLVLVGDPKQAIYGFRGGDIETYIDAVADAALLERRSLTVNWRSDGAALTALGVLFEGATFGDESIRFVPVAAAPGGEGRRMRDGGGDPLPALLLRLAVGAGIDRTKVRAATEVQVDSASRAIESDLVSRIHDLLDHARIPTGGDDGSSRRVRPQDIAVLVNKNEQCADMQAALAHHGVPAVVAKGGSVLRSPAADQLRWLFHAMGRPADARRARMYALSWFGGWSADSLAGTSDAALAELQEELRGWSERLATCSVADVLAQIWSESGVMATVLAQPDGDRNITDLDHLAELLHGASSSGRSNVAGLLAALDTEPELEGDAELDSDKVARRIESEAEAVQVMTLWTAKGLEFPIVCVPTLWRWTGLSDPVIYVDPDTRSRTFDLAKGTTWPTEQEARERKDLAAREIAGERQRLLYVALTRARHQTIVWWANGQDSARTALARLLFARGDTDVDPVALESAVAIPSDHEIVAVVSPLAEASEGTITVESIDLPSGDAPRWIGPESGGARPPLRSARFSASPDRSSQRWSFSSITRHASMDASDPYDTSLGDGGAADETPEIRDGTENEDGSPGTGYGSVSGGPERPIGALSRLPAGAAFGTLVHSVLEQVDFAAPDLDETLGASIDRELARRSLDLTPTLEAAGAPGEGRVLLVDGLREAIHTPLGPMCLNRRLVDVGRGDRLNEVAFDLRLGGTGRPPLVAEIGQVVTAHLQPSDPLHGWSTALADGAIDLPLAGHLTGSIDLVMRITDALGDQRFVVADYKTNDLSPRGQIPAPRDYHPSCLAVAMADHDYPLQALLYAVAVHRYLRWRLPGYEPSIHLGGVAYLFLRGMTGPEVTGGSDRPHGVFSWPVPPALVVALSQLLAGHPAGELLS